ncbi:MAG: beta-ketoacyl synthase N-terminal-like domain-containing protein, partial [Myxococcota bacterium]
WMVRTVAAATGLAPEQVAADEPWSSHGLDSLRLIRLAGNLADHFGQPLPPTLFFDYPSIAAMARYLSQVSAGMADDQPAAAAARTRTRRSADDEPIAVIGLACRFPGAADADAYFAMLREGRQAITAPSTARPGAAAWQRAAEKEPAARRSGFIDDIDTFDPALFSIAKREARAIDPQQRLLLQTAWHAFEDAGYPLPALADSPTGVFVGISSSDYARLLVAATSRGSVDMGPYAGTGNALSVAANRLSYVFDLRGPSVAIDTACSSSLVAVHQACSSLRAGESTLAVAGGVNLLLAPDLSLVFAKAGMLAPDGMVKTFDTRADGYVRGEGCGLVVLKRHADAVADGDRVLALIRGSAVNQDGRSNGLTAPNGLSQRAVIRAALARAGVAPGEVAHVEAHGTGTSLGDAIELTALRAVYCEPVARQTPLVVGSVKTNIGHLEAAAGVAGLIKVVLALAHGEWPAHCNLDTPIQAAENDDVRIATTTEPWPRAERNLAGLSSFGFGGTNAHVILSSAPAPADKPQIAGEGAQPLVLSAGDPDALRARARQVASHLRTRPDTPFAEVCRAAAVERTALPCRLVAVAQTAADASATLDQWSTGSAADEALDAIDNLADDLPPGRASNAGPGVAMLFPGQGSHYSGMGCELYRRVPTFRRWLDRCDAILSEQLGVGLLDLLSGLGSAGDLLGQTRFAQPALFALEAALAETLMAWGIRPTRLLGHSVGEYTAAYLAGVFGLEDGLRLMAARGELVQRLPDGGGMLAVRASTEALEPLLEQVRNERDSGQPAPVIAAINGPDRTVLSGALPALDALSSALEKAGMESRRLAVSHAFHSPLLEPIAAEFGELVAALSLRPPQREIISNVTGSAIGADMASADYWVRHLLQPVRFADGVHALLAGGADGPAIALEVGPGAALLAMARETRAASDAEPTWLPILRRTVAEDRSLARALGALHVRGTPLDWPAILGGRPTDRGLVPPYPFKRDSYWFSSTERGPALADERGRAAGHPLLGAALDVPAGRDLRFEARVGPTRPRWLGDHRALGAPVMPAAAWIEIVLAARRAVATNGSAESGADGEPVVEIRDLRIETPLRFTDDESIVLHTAVAPGQHGHDVAMFSASGQKNGQAGMRWTRHAAAQVAPGAAAPEPL